MRHRAAKVAVGLPAACFAYFSYLYLTVPDVRALATTNPPTTAFIELRAAEARAAGQKPRRVQRWIRYEAISNNLRRAVLVAEDDAFWQHDGVDVEQLRKSIESNLEKRKMARGGSTITQQLAKNLYLSPSRSPIRKLREFLIARKLEAALSKRRIFEIYLNVIEWGDGIYGADAAARRYFGKSAAGAEPGRGGAHGRCYHQSASPQSGAPDGAPKSTPADHPETHGMGRAAAGSARDSGTGAADDRARTATALAART